jgi:hypothetical protein
MTMVIQPKLTPLGVQGGPASLERSESKLDEEIDLAAAGNTVVGKCKADKVEKVGKDTEEE